MRISNVCTGRLGFIPYSFVLTPKFSLLLPENRLQISDICPLALTPPASLLLSLSSHHIYNPIRSFFCCIGRIESDLIDKLVYFLEILRSVEIFYIV